MKIYLYVIDVYFNQSTSSFMHIYTDKICKSIKMKLFFLDKAILPKTANIFIAKNVRDLLCAYPSHIAQVASTMDCSMLQIFVLLTRSLLHFEVLKSSTSMFEGVLGSNLNKSQQILQNICCTFVKVQPPVVYYNPLQ